VRPFTSWPTFAILIHPNEAKRNIATGRMAHLCLSNSELIQGFEFNHNARVNALLQNPEYYPVVLYPGGNSVNLTPLTVTERLNLFPANRQPLLLVIDGTWDTSRRMMRLSENLHSLPRVCFFPNKPSTFRVRKQPTDQCYSTLEAIHHVIDLLLPEQAAADHPMPHDNLLVVFNAMVEQQLRFATKRVARRGLRKRAVSI